MGKTNKANKENILLILNKIFARSKYYLFAVNQLDKAKKKTGNKRSFAPLVVSEEKQSYLKVGVSEVTVSRWANQGAWKVRRARALM